jgi:glucuronate isomerase
MDRDFLLQSKTARMLYHQFAADMPIFDYHCHLPPHEIAQDRQWGNLAEIWLGGDHYKWRAMRTNGIEEKLITGDASWPEKFTAWARTVPCAMRNPLYHWSHLELQRCFGVDQILSPETADEIFETCSAMLQSPEFSARNLMRKMNIKAVCTTDDPADDLQHHLKISEDGFEIKVLPTFRPDKAMIFSKDWKKYIATLAKVSGVEIGDFESLMAAVDRRHEFFHSAGCRLSDHGVTCVPDADATPAELNAIFRKAMNGGMIGVAEREKFEAVFLYEAGKMNHARGWVQQIHVGVFRNNNSRMFRQLGPDTGFDSIADVAQEPGLIRLLDRLDSANRLTKTILYNINPADNELMATLVGCFQGGGIPGKMQLGSGWWFLDQKDGMEKQMNALSAMGLLSRFTGMLTDSRSFLSYPRHEYFRRILCNLIGADVENGELPDDIPQLGKMVQDICFNNAENYFGIEL